jgi:3-phenylpropionate/cinnamic acid dioxygenase small subunit
MSQLSNFDGAALLATGSQLVQREALLLDDALWDQWLDLYVEDCTFWVPAWRADGTLVDNPRREVSHIYAAGRGALGDRIYRIRSTMAVSSVPMQRTTHILSASHLLSAPEPDRMRLRTAWSSHVYFPRTKTAETYFGDYEHRLVDRGDGWRIEAKKVVIKRDYIPTMMDFYFV